MNSLEKRKISLFKPQQKKLLVIFLKISYLRSTRLNDSTKFICQFTPKRSN
ncbi:hypothetical protein EU99_0250 [Prochlorococcus marinus str. MIT 9321]|uniref:Uncharacterized protein n=1 Tax=Prochlorococcus marinus str. MIT 9401 TaxID=167551 RepID=A0A0A2B080_PROMR|nr:hypothetical protein EV00_1988 [Prochlorococcus marinus str. MIT 9322]KGG05680.1 hypothetical protein EU99_0250 [Prochlorococcus marinus str. MIT 9321]KGG07493.1 hypothetical protein EV01_1108 [Prochlorococcus marinus str. MIT 9401]